MSGTKLKVRVYPDPCLRKKAAAVKAVTVSERILIKAMIETMHEHKGIGLAAPQVGVSEQIFVTDVGDGPRVFINPKVIKHNGSVDFEEGCLSIPDVTVMIHRPETITVRFMDENNKVIEQECSELLARVVQHETDHLHGKLIIDYATKEQEETIGAQLEELEANFNNQK